MTDEDLARAYQERRDAGCFATLLQRHSPWLRSMVLTLCHGEREEAEDVLQEIALAVARDLPRFNFQSNLRTWLFRLGRNKAIDHLRQRQRKRLGLAAYQREQSLRVSTSPSAESIAMRSLEEAELWRLVDSLQPAERLLVWMRYVQEWPLEQIAKHLACSEGAVKVRMHRLKKQLVALSESKEKHHE